MNCRVTRIAGGSGKEKSIAGGIIETGALKTKPGGSRKPVTERSSKGQIFGACRDTTTGARKKGRSKEATPDREGAVAGPRLVGPQGGGGTRFGALPAGTEKEAATRTSNLGEEGDAEEESTTIEGLELSRLEIGKRENSCHETAVTLTEQDRTLERCDHQRTLNRGKKGTKRREEVILKMRNSTRRFFEQEKVNARNEMPPFQSDQEEGALGGPGTQLSDEHDKLSDALLHGKISKGKAAIARRAKDNVSIRLLIDTNLGESDAGRSGLELA